jgi:hypothetical protein
LTDPSQEADTAKYRTLIYYVIKWVLLHILG